MTKQELVEKIKSKLKLYSKKELDDAYNKGFFKAIFCDTVSGLWEDFRKECIKKSQGKVNL